MDIETSDINGYRVVRVKGDLARDCDLSELKAAVKEQVEGGAQNVAITFTEKSHFYSRTIAVLVQFFGLVKEHDGNLVIVHPSIAERKMFALVGLGRLIRTVATESQIGTAGFLDSAQDSLPEAPPG